ncbi:alpha/beta hydrolase [Paraconexibacter antarcticus]|uniref:Alpha/beta hydrolase n=1 Tax=Paraconexibacter antarcticus TaxID=2949664 RepID=A0ABY5DSS9_9ACTN|nr:alpha/beta family hydrolase [Paraconexibacter antarcticus]UTI64736.1 alpha/beta hydrolase [Paraconexibacter antarcticus]
MAPLTLPTPPGEARVHLHAAAGEPAGALVLGHGAGGSITAPDLQAVTAAATAAGVTVALVEQPYRVAGRRNAPPAATLDAAWLPIVGQLRAGPLAGLPVVCGGRSSGARVACRTAAAAGAAGVLALAFPLQPPNARKDGTLGPSRRPELEAAAAACPVLVVQGETDRFGMVPDGVAPGVTLARIRGDHGLKGDRAALTAAVLTWLCSVLPGARPA